MVNPNICKNCISIYKLVADFRLVRLSTVAISFLLRSTPIEDWSKIYTETLAVEVGLSIIANLLGNSNWFILTRFVASTNVENRSRILR